MAGRVYRCLRGLVDYEIAGREIALEPGKSMLAYKYFFI